MMQKNLKNDWNPAKWVHIWEYSARAIQWITAWQGLDGFQKSLHTSLTHMQLVANLANTKWCKKPVKWLKPWHMGTHLRELSEGYPINTNMTRFRWLSTIFAYLVNSYAVGG